MPCPFYSELPICCHFWSKNKNCHCNTDVFYYLANVEIVNLCMKPLYERRCLDKAGKGGSSFELTPGFPGKALTTQPFEILNPT